MSRGIHFSLFALMAVLIFSGCQARPQTNRQINSLQAQVGVLTDELIRLDEQLQAMRASLMEGPVSRAGAPISPVGQEAYVGAMYRTPSGFQLPAISIQQALKNAGYYDGPIDGKIGPQSRRAIQAFQRDNGLAPDGVVGRNTWQMLKVYASVSK